MGNGKVLFITGATQGIGLETALLFAKNGYNIAFNGINSDDGARLKREFEALGVDAEFYFGDVTVEDEVNKMLQRCGERFGKIDCLINNAGGLGGRSQVEEMTTQFWDRVHDLNLKSVFFVTRAAVPYLKKSGDASIINITSIAAYNGGGPGASAYASAKAGVLAFTRGLAKELIPFGIRVNAISPGTIDTAFHSAATAEMLESWRQGIPAKRLGKPSEVADLMFFLASEHSSYLVGEVIQINGGQMML